jgi:hypothetical protein
MRLFGRTVGRVVAGLIGLTAIGAVSMASAAGALASEPTGAFAVFAQCPRHSTEVQENEISCLYSITESGEVKIGNSAVPITNPIVLQGAVFTNNETEAQTFSPALNGETLSKSPEKVPGGLAGLVKCDEISNGIERLVCEVVFENGLTGVNATTELALPGKDIGISTSNLLNSEGVALSLPLKIKLENPLLGSGCYIGSEAHPVTFNLTTGITSPPPPNEPISGKVGDLAFKEEGEGHKLIEITDDTLVDNAFSAPEVTGCGGALASVLDPIIDSKLELPAAAGKNTAIQNNYIRQASAAAVISSE